MNFNKSIKSEYYIDSLLLLFSVILLYYTKNFPFYWDNIIQISVPANWYYENDFKYFYVPGEYATGHPTFVGMYFAILWKLFGRSLFVCHLGMLPFIFGLLLQIRILLRNIGISDKMTVLLITIFVLSDATFLSQLSLITFETIQLFFFILCINLILKRKDKLFAISFLFLSMTSLRGSIIAAGVLIFNILYYFYCTDRKEKINFIKFLPGAASLLVFLILFKIHNGWVIHNTVSKEWESSGEFASIQGMIYNVIIFIWRIIDFGRIGICLFFLIFVFKSIKGRSVKDRAIKILFFIMLGQFILFFPILIPSKIPFGHRYFLPMLIPMIILTVYWIRSSVKYSSYILASIFLILFSGNFWLYPAGISQGWDATTMHWKYFSVSEQMHTYINKAHIDKREIGTYFPNRRSRYFTHLEDDKNDLYGGTPLESKYLIYSNAFNVNKEIINSLQMKNSQWKLVKKFSENRVFICLYQKK
jgi:hypothetical protein